MDQTQRDGILALIEDFLAYMEVAAPYQRVPRSMRVPLSAFKRAEPFGSAPLEDLVGADRTYMSHEENPAHWLPAFDVSLLIPRDQPGERFSLMRARSLSPQETRGRIRPWTPHAAHVMGACICNDGRYVSGQTIMGYVGGSWRRVSTGAWDWEDAEYAPDGQKLVMSRVSAAHQHAVYRTLLWHVEIAYGGQGASLLLPCTAGAILDLFRYRDLPPGKSRRDALLHWVSDHWRRKVSDPAEVTQVTEHLRGQTRFVWREGLVVQIMPSEEDRKRVKEWHKHASDPVAPR
jgi:hypothetical protein